MKIYINNNGKFIIYDDVYWILKTNRYKVYISYLPEPSIKQEYIYSFKS